jgi:hypothetical protein
MRGNNYRHIENFSYGTDMTSFKGVIQKYLDRSPLLQNVRLREDGKCRRRYGHKRSITDNDFLEVSGTYEFPTSIVRPSNMVDPVIAALYTSNSSNSRFRLIYPGTATPEKSIGDYAVVQKKVYTASPCLKMVADERDFNTTFRRVFAPSGLTVDIPNAIYDGSIIDYAAANAKARHWGIYAPAAAPTVAELTDGDASNYIPAATLEGWYYFYTYVRLVFGSLVSESPPSPIMAARFAPTVACKHRLSVVASTDPQVTGIRIYRTTGQTGLEDGTSIQTAGKIADYSNATANIDLDKNLPASLGNLLDTIGQDGSKGYYSYGDPASPNPACGYVACIYKDSVIIGGYNNYVYYTDNRPEEKFKYLFSTIAYADFYSRVISIFVHGNDIIICTERKTWRIVDGNWADKRLVSEDVGVVSPNSVAYDLETERTLALTNKGVRAWDGQRWSEDLSYQIKDITNNRTYYTNTFFSSFASGVVNGREYYLSMPNTFPSRDPSDTPLLIGFLNNDGSISWTIDRTVVAGVQSLGVVTGGFVKIDDCVYGVLNFLDGSSVLGYFIKFDSSDTISADFASRTISVRIDLPRLIHDYPVNYVRGRTVRAIITGIARAVYPAPAKTINLIGTGDGGNKTQTAILTQSSEDVIQFDGAFDDCYGRGYIDFYIAYTGTEAIIFNSLTYFYLWRDDSKENVEVSLGGVGGE